MILWLKFKKVWIGLKRLINLRKLIKFDGNIIKHWEIINRVNEMFEDLLNWLLIFYDSMIFSKILVILYLLQFIILWILNFYLVKF